MAKKRSSKAAAPQGFSLDALREKLEKAQQLTEWVEAAHTHREQFPPDVVQTVIDDYLTKYETMLPGLEELSTAAADERTQLAERAAELETARSTVEAQLDEFKLRKLIGEFSEEDFKAKEKEVRGTFDSALLNVTEGSMRDIDDLLSAVGEVRNRIQAIQKPAPGGTATAESAPAVDLPSAEPASDPSPPPDELGEEAYKAGGGGVQDEWDVEPPPSDEASGDGGWQGADAPPASEAVLPPMPEGEDLMATGVIQAQPRLADGPAPPVHSTSEFSGADATPPGEGPRLAVTPPDGEQVIYPFNGDVMSLGRGRNNDIQIKNDGKISRYHCRIFRRGDEFIVEDNKSSNGTLVDGKLVTRQRLEGGEVVQLGETRVQFIAS
jgi:predicted component of type VI protein secretion system